MHSQFQDLSVVYLTRTIFSLMACIATGRIFGTHTLRDHASLWSSTSGPGTPNYLWVTSGDRLIKSQLQAKRLLSHLLDVMQSLRVHAKDTDILSYNLGYFRCASSWLQLITYICQIEIGVPVCVPLHWLNKKWSSHRFKLWPTDNRIGLPGSLGNFDGNFTIKKFGSDVRRTMVVILSAFSIRIMQSSYLKQMAR